MSVGTVRRVGAAVPIRLAKAGASAIDAIAPMAIICFLYGFIVIG